MLRGIAHTCRCAAPVALRRSGVHNLFWMANQLNILHFGGASLPYEVFEVDGGWSYELCVVGWLCGSDLTEEYLNRMTRTMNRTENARRHKFAWGFANFHWPEALIFALTCASGCCFVAEEVFRVRPARLLLFVAAHSFGPKLYVRPLLLSRLPFLCPTVTMLFFLL